MLQYTNISDRVLSSGIDQDSSETSIKEGFVEDALNMDVEADGLTRRKGFEIFAGDMPLRAETLILDDSTDPQTIQFILPSYVDLSNVTGGPIRVQGTFTYDSGTSVEFGVTADFPSYFESYIRIESFNLEASGTTLTAPPVSTGINSITRLVGLQTVEDHSVFFPEGLSIDTATYNITVTYGVTEDTEAFIYSHPCNAGEYYLPVAPETFLETSPAVWECTLTAAGTGLPNLNIIPQFYTLDTGVYSQVLPDGFSIDNVNGTVTFRIAAVLEPTDFVPLLCSTTRPSADGVTTGAVGATTVTIENAESTHIFAACYLEDPLTGNLDLVLPDSITYSEELQTHQIRFTHPHFDLSYKIIYEYGTSITNQLIVELPGNPLTASEEVTSANVVIHGILQSELPTKTFVNFLDGYRSEDRIVTGADGLVYTSTTSLNYTGDIDIRRRIAGPINIGPLFVDSTPLLPRTQGNIISNEVVNGYVRVVSVLYSGVEGQVTYRLKVDGHGLVVGDPIHLTYDRLTVSKLTSARHNGNFEILDSEVIDSTYIDVTVSNTIINSHIWNIPSAYGMAGIFTDKLSFLATRPLSFQVGDLVNISPTYLVSISSLVTGEPLSVIIDNAFEPAELATGLRLGPTRMDTTYYLNTWDNDLVQGDVVNFNGVPTQIVAIDVTAQTITLRDSMELSEGVAIISRPFTWEIVPSPLGMDIITRTEIIRSVSGAGSIYLSNGLKYDGSKMLKSGLPSLQNHLFVTVDENAPGIDITPEQSAISVISSSSLEVTVSNINLWSIGNLAVLRRSLIATPKWQVDTENVYVIQNVDTATGKVTLSTPPNHTEFGADDSVGTTFDVAVYEYYLCKFVDMFYSIRLRYVDDFGKIAVGPTTGELDIRVRLTNPATVGIRAQVFPNTDNLYDYDNIQLDLFRRFSEDSVAIKVDSKALADATTRFIDFKDTTPLGYGTKADADPVVSPVAFSIGETRSGPPFAADWITSINNQVVYGGITTAPKVVLSLNGSVEASDFIGHIWTVDGVEYEVVDPSSTIVITGNVTVTPDTSFEITDAALAAAIVEGDVIYIANTDVTSVEATTKLLGWFEVADITGNVVTILAPGIEALTAYEDLDLVVYHSTGTVPLAGTIAHYNIGQSSARTNSIIQAFPLHLASAITWRQIGTDIFARGGGDLTRGLIQVFSDIAGIEVIVPNFTTVISKLTLFGNDRQLAPLDSILTRSTRYGSRLVLSTKYFPEVFEDIDAQLGIRLPLVDDIAPEDGESTTGAIPFFATAAFGAAQQTSVLTIFKPHAVYIMDAQAKYINQGEVLKQIQSNGVGCEAPKSLITATDGVWFASRGGLYLLDRSLTVKYVGKHLERFYQGKLLNQELLDRCVGSNYAVDRMFRLSFPTVTEEKWTSGVFTYKAPDDIQTAEGLVATGRWTRYGDEFSATMWANLTAATLFASSQGVVGILKNTGTSVDYSDAGSDIAGEITFRSMDFGLPLTKKVLRSFTVYYRTETDFTKGQVSLQSAVDLSTHFEDADEAKVNSSVVADPNLLGDVSRNKLDKLQYSPVVSKATWFQVKLQVAGIGKDLYIDRLIYRVASIRTRGVEQAGERE